MRGQEGSREPRLQQRVKISNPSGLHARPCHAIVTAALGYASRLRVKHGEREVNGKSILELMTLGAAQGTELELLAEGQDAEALLAHVSDLVLSGFGEGCST